MNTTPASAAALEKLLSEKLRELLGAIPWLSHAKVERNPAKFNRAFDLLARFRVPREAEIELWVDCNLEPRPSRFPYVAIDRQFEKTTGATKRVRVGVFAAPHISPRM